MLQFIFLDTVLRKSRSLNELIGLTDDVSEMEASDYLAMLEQVKPPAVTFPTYTHQKSTSFDRQSTVSGSVFVSDRDASFDDHYQHRLLCKTPSAENRSDKTSSAFLAPSKQSFCNLRSTSCVVLIFRYVSC